MPKIYRVESPATGSPHLFIATGGYELHPNYAASLARSLLDLPRAGVAIDVCFVAENCHVDDTRNALIREFLRTKCTDLVFVDNDVGWDPEALLRLARHKRDFVAGVYPLKQVEEDYPVMPFEGQALYADADGLVEVKGVPGGFMKLSRACIETMIEKLGDRKYWGRHQSKDEAPEIILFERTYENGIRYSGDYAFCRKWESLGGKVYVDPELPLSHHGGFEWSGTLGDFWKRRHGVKAEEDRRNFADAVRALRAGQATAETFVHLRQGWGNERVTAPPELLSACWHMARETNGPILECGSGLSTIVLALANAKASVYALENDPIWAMKVRDACQEHGIENVFVSCHALKSYGDAAWYDTRDLAGLDFSLVLCDGPWRSLGRRALLFEAFGAPVCRATIIVDDAEDEAHMAAFRTWATMNGRQIHLLALGRFAVSGPPPVLAQAAE